MNNIIDPLTNNKYLIYSKQGKKLLKKYITLFYGGTEKIEEIDITGDGNQDDDDDDDFRKSLELSQQNYAKPFIDQIITFLLYLQRINLLRITTIPTSVVRAKIIQYLRKPPELIRNDITFLHNLFEQVMSFPRSEGNTLMLRDIHLAKSHDSDGEPKETKLKPLEIIQIQEKIIRLEEIRQKIRKLFVDSKTFVTFFKNFDILDKQLFTTLFDKKKVQNEYDLLLEIAYRYSIDTQKGPELLELTELSDKIQEILFNEIEPLLEEVIEVISRFDENFIPPPTLLIRMNAMISIENPIIHLLYYYMKYASNANINYIEQLINRLKEKLVEKTENHST